MNETRAVWPRTPGLSRGAAAAMLAVLGIAGCTAPSTTPSTTQEEPPTVASPPQGVGFDYQLGGSYAPAQDVGILIRDRTAAPEPTAYSICYINAFQTQPAERDLWDEELLLTRNGTPVMDPDWPEEQLLDVGTEQRRAQIADLVGEWIGGCAEAGYQAVEFDNLDSFTRSGGQLHAQDALALAAKLVDIAHRAGLAAGQKNAAEYAADLRQVAGFDFAVAEECAAYAECSTYREVYGEAVLDIEYTDNLPESFARLCARPETPQTMILRDRDLLAAERRGHVRQTCAETD